jgi:hypothetical protein
LGEFEVLPVLSILLICPSPPVLQISQPKRPSHDNNLPAAEQPLGASPHSNVVRRSDLFCSVVRFEKRLGPLGLLQPSAPFSVTFVLHVQPQTPGLSLLMIHGVAKIEAAFAF